MLPVVRSVGRRVRRLFRLRRGAPEGRVGAGAAWLLVTLLFGAVAGCGDDRSDEVIVYVAVDDHAARPVLALFTEQHGVRVRPLFDSEVNKTTALVSRLRAERDAPKADLFWSSEAVQAGRLAIEGVLDTSEATLTPTMLRARVLVYDPRRIAAEDLPRDWWDLADERFRNRVAMADPRFGSTGGHLAAMHAWCLARGEPERFEQWTRSLRQNGVKQLTSGNAGVVRMVASGECDFGMTDTDDVAALLAQPGAPPLSMVALRHGPELGAGPFLITGIAAIVAGAPNRPGAERLLAFLASHEAQERLEMAAPGFHSIASAEAHGLVDGLQVDSARAEASFSEAVALMLGVRAGE